MNTDKHGSKPAWCGLPTAYCLLPTAYCLVLLVVLPAVVARAEIVDRIVVTVGQRLITLSDVREAYAVQSMLNQAPMQPLDSARLRETAERLVDQVLLQQEVQANRFPPLSPREMEQRKAEIRKKYGDEAAFQRALAERGLDEAHFWQVVEDQLNILRFVDLRLRPNAQEEAPAIERYYREKLAPELKAHNAPIPELDQVRDKIAEVIAQERMNQEYASWIKELRSQANIRYR